MHAFSAELLTALSFDNFSSPHINQKFFLSIWILKNRIGVHCTGIAFCVQFSYRNRGARAGVSLLHRQLCESIISVRRQNRRLAAQSLSGARRHSVLSSHYLWASSWLITLHAMIQLLDCSRLPAISCN